MTKRNVPELRLAGFDGEWVETTVGRVSTIHNGKDYKHLNPGPIPVYGTGGYMCGVDQALSAQKDAVGIGRKGTINKPLLLIAPFWTVDTLFYLIPSRTTNLHFFFAAMLQIDWASKNTGTGLPSLTSTTIASSTLTAPLTLAEQEAIGAVFSDLDAVIEKHEQKHRALQQTKAALMQRMFPQEGETEPRLRMEGFNGMWNKLSLHQILTFINGRAYAQSELQRSGKYPVLRVGNFYTNSSWYFSDLELSDKYYAENGDLLYTWSASFGPQIWRGQRVIYHYHIWKIELSDSLNREFAYSIFDKDKTEIMTQTNGSTMVHVTKDRMEKKQIMLPPTLAEQEAIGAVFSKLDGLITAEAKLVEKLKQTKTALLQKMFV